MATPADHAACAAAIRAGSKSFFAASLLLPRRVRKPALALYAFCRQADDAVDLAGPLDPLSALRERLERIYAGCPVEKAADRALTEVVAQYSIPRELPLALLEGFQWDIEGRRYEDLEQLKAYAARVAGAVGEMMAYLLETHSPEALSRAADLGIAMQLTNIARDVGEDARAGRLYLPLSWLREAGVDADAWLANPMPLPSIIERLLDVADQHYQRADVGISLLPRDCRCAIAAARHLYAEIGHQLRRAGCDSISKRTVVPTVRKLQILLRVLGERQSRIDERAEWLIDLFERLERRDRSRAS